MMVVTVVVMMVVMVVVVEVAVPLVRLGLGGVCGGGGGGGGDLASLRIQYERNIIRIWFLKFIYFPAKFVREHTRVVVGREF